MTTIPFSLRNNIGLEDSTTYNLEQILFNKEFTEFIHCPISLKGSYEIPDTVEVIGIESFARCAELASITIPKSIKTIKCLAFADCTGLKTIFIQSDTPITFTPDSDIFQNVDKKNCRLIVPKGSKVNYQRAYQWNEFKTIREATKFSETHSQKSYFETSKQAI